MTSLRATLLSSFLLTISACADAGNASPSDDDSVGEAYETDLSADDDDSTSAKKDASTSGSGKDASSSSGGGKDAGRSEPKDGGTSAAKDSASTSQTADAGKGGVDAGKDAGGSFMLPDLFPTSDAGGSKTDAAVGAPGDKSGPCKDLQLLCFDPIDMFLFNPSDCFTCNGGEGCKGCAIPFAY
jgi:hypothetical protein